MSFDWRAYSLVALLVTSFVTAPAFSQQNKKQTTEPVYRVSKLDNAGAPKPVTNRHPVDPALDMAYNALHHLRSNIKNYSATLIKRERINGKLGPNEFMDIKIRNRVDVQGKKKVPFSAYIKFQKPSSLKGRECIWVEGQNDGKLIAHDTGVIRGALTVNLDPNGWLAMQGQRYPIYDIGFENLGMKLIEKGKHDRNYGNIEVKFFKNAKINDRSCTMIEVVHPQKTRDCSYHKVQIFIDDLYKVPVRYSNWSWPATPGGKEILEEQYTYIDVKINRNITDIDFEKTNPKYAFP